jgi:hypothetical protein
MNTSNASNTNKPVRTIKDEVRHLGKRKRALSYEQMVEAIKAKHPKAQTSVKTVQWYASRLRKEGETVNVKDGRSEGRAEH